MTLNKLGQPFQGVAWYWIENSYGVVSTPSLNELPISCKIQNIRIDTGDRHKVLRDIGSPLACNLLKQTHEPKVHLEYIPQAGDTMIDDTIDRSSTCTLQSISMCVGMNTKMVADADDVSYYVINGMKPATVRITSSKNTEYLVVIDYEAKSIITLNVLSTYYSYPTDANNSNYTTHTGLTGSAPSVLTGNYLQFNVAGEIRKTGYHVVNTDHIAFITNSIELTVTHKLTPYTDHDSLYKTYIIEGDMDVEGSVDITLDGGGALHIDEVLNNRSFEIVIDMGTMSAAANVPRITLPACEWKSSSVDGNIGGEAMISSVPFTAKPSACNNLVSTPTV